jgi:hypothetical protein
VSTTSTPYELPGGGGVELEGTIAGVADSDGVADSVLIHAELAASRPIERWRDKPAFMALLRSYSEEFQEIENAFWDVLVLRFPDYAFGEGLNMLGRIVGVARGARTDAQYRNRIKVQVAINSSDGTAEAICGILKMLDPAAFEYRDTAPAAFRLYYTEAPATTAIQAEIPGIVRVSRAVGIGASISQPVENPGVLAGQFTFTDAGGEPTDGFGFGDSNDPPGSDAGALGWYSRA